MDVPGQTSVRPATSAFSPAVAPPPERPSRLARALAALAGAVYRFPRAFFYPQALLFLASILFTVWRLDFDTNRNHLVGEDKKYHQAYLRYRREFAAQDELVVLVESEDIEKNRQFVERLGARLEAETNLFTDIFYKGDLKLMGPKALLFVTNETILREMAQRLREARPMLDNFARVTNLNSLFQTVTAGFRSAARDPDAAAPVLEETLPALGRIAEQAADALRRPGTPPSPGITALFGGGDRAEESLYLTFASNRIYLVTARPLHERLNEAAVQRLRTLLEQTRAEVPGVNAGLTGGPVLEVDEMAQARRDNLLASLVALGLCALLFIYGYQETGRPIKAVACLMVGLAYTLAYATATIGHLNILTVTFLPILIGLGIDFGIHLVSRYEEELRLGQSELRAITLALSQTGRGILTGCLTTAGAFLAMGFTDFKGVREMGLICGGGLLLCLIPMMTLLPVLLLRGRQNLLDHARHPPPETRARLERLWLDRPALTLGLTGLLTVLAGVALPRVRFDYNLLNLQSAGLPAVVFEHKLIQHAGRSVIFGVVTAASLEEARALQSRLEALPSVAGVDSMVNHLTEDQTHRLALVRQIRAEVAGLSCPDVDPEPVNLGELRLTLRRLQAYLGLGASLSERGGEEALSETLREVRAAVARLNAALAAADPEAAAQKLGAFQRALLHDLHETLRAIQNQDDTAPLRPEDIPAPLRHRFISKSGDRYLLQVNPRSNVWERVPQEVFVRELRQVDPEVTGEPVQLYEYTTLLKDSYIEAAWYALAAVMGLVWLHFRRLLALGLALLPVGLGMVWLAGGLGWVNQPFNPANIMTLPLVVGIGVTNGIQVLHRFAEEGRPTIFSRSTGKAVLLSALTTVAGFGSLMLAQHRGIASLGLVMSLGTLACLVAAVVVLPAALTLLQRRGWHLGHPAGRGAETSATTPVSLR